MSSRRGLTLKHGLVWCRWGGGNGRGRRGSLCLGHHETSKNFRVSRLNRNTVKDWQTLRLWLKTPQRKSVEGLDWVLTQVSNSKARACCPAAILYPPFCLRCGCRLTEYGAVEVRCRPTCLLCKIPREWVWWLYVNSSGVVPRIVTSVTGEHHGQRLHCFTASSNYCCRRPEPSDAARAVEPTRPAGAGRTHLRACEGRPAEHPMVRMSQAQGRVFAAECYGRSCLTNLFKWFMHLRLQEISLFGSCKQVRWTLKLHTLATLQSVISQLQMLAEVSTPYPSSTRIKLVVPWCMNARKRICEALVRWTSTTTGSCCLTAVPTARGQREATATIR